MTPEKWSVRNTIPENFVCPISLEIMTNPVVLESGITYDRVSIERWLASGHDTCPVSRKILHSKHLTPNDTLRRLIWTWIQSSRSQFASLPAAGTGAQDIRYVSWLLQQIFFGKEDIDNLRELKLNATYSQRVRDYIKSAGAVPAIASLVGKDAEQVRDGNTLAIEKSDESIAILSLVGCCDDETASLLTRPGALECIGRALSLGNWNVRVYAVVLAESVATHRRWRESMGNCKMLVGGLVEVLSDDFSPTATRSSLNALVSLCTSKLTRVIAVKAGAITVLVDLLRRDEKNICEKVLAALELLFLCPEGRTAGVAHSQAIPRIVDRVLTVSKEATEYAIGALWSLCNYFPFLSGYYDALRAGALEKANLVLLQGDCSRRTSYQTRQLLNSLHTASFLLDREGNRGSKIPSSHTTKRGGHQAMSQLEVIS